MHLSTVRLFVLVVAVLWPTLSAGGAAAQVTPVASASPLHVAGNQLKDASNVTVALRGVNRSGTEYACIQGWGFFDGPSDQASVDAMKTWGINMVRIPLNEACWLATANSIAAYSGPAYQSAIKTYVDLLTRNGIYSVLDLQWSAPRGTEWATSLHPMPDADYSPSFWTSVAQTFGPNGAVIFDLFNEPYPDNNQDTTAAWTCWRDGGDCSAQGVWYPVAGMQTLVNAIRATGATNVIDIAGVQYANAVGRWLAYAPTDPLRNLVAVTHVYDNQICRDASCFDLTVAPLARTVPVLVLEFGSNCDGSWMTTQMDYWDAHGIGYAAWTWNTWGTACDSHSLITDYSGTPTSPVGTTFRAHLSGAPTPTPTPTATPTTTATPTPTPTATAVTPPSPSPTPASSATPSASTPSGTPTPPPSPSSRATPTPSATRTARPTRQPNAPDAAVPAAPPAPVAAPPPQPRPEKAAFHSAWVDQSAYPILQPGQTEVMTVRFRNTGSAPWVKGVVGQQANLGVSDDGSPYFYSSAAAFFGAVAGDPASGMSVDTAAAATAPSSTDRAWSLVATGWPTADRASVQTEAVVQPGAIGTFTFSVQAPATLGTYQLRLRPVIDGTTWMEDQGVFVLVTSRSGYHSGWVSQSAYPTVHVGLLSEPITMSFRNVGSVPWIGGVLGKQVNLGVSGDASAWSSSAADWPTADRVATQTEAMVAVGQTASFTFRVRAPIDPGTYRLSLRPVVDGTIWLEDEGVYVLITVLP